MKYKDIKDFNARCDDHPAHQEGMVSNGMLIDRLMEEVEELRAYIEKCEWVGLYWGETESEWIDRIEFLAGAEWAEAKLKEKNA